MNRLVSVLVLIYVVCIMIALVTISVVFARNTKLAVEDAVIDIKSETIKTRN